MKIKLILMGIAIICLIGLIHFIMQSHKVDTNSKESTIASLQAMLSNNINDNEKLLQALIIHANHCYLTLEADKQNIPEDQLFNCIAKQIDQMSHKQIIHSSVALLSKQIKLDKQLDPSDQMEDYLRSLLL